ncbi:hypothetical protein LCGC14_0548460 [marine sediment metagenome]|uniref:Uncharacterized protein n=1 Tax=marine sediment metagenome TaxID=412755 RepID=A0A0F9RQV9_9ZZZZ
MAVGETELPRVLLTAVQAPRSRPSRPTVFLHSTGILHHPGYDPITSRTTCMLQSSSMTQSSCHRSGDLSLTATMVPPHPRQEAQNVTESPSIGRPGYLSGSAACSSTGTLYQSCLRSWRSRASEGLASPI